MENAARVVGGEEKVKEESLLDQVLQTDITSQGSRGDEGISFERLLSLGLNKAASKLSAAQRMEVAYKGYSFITPEAIQRFNEELRKETLKEDKRAYRFKQLIFTNLDQYDKIPPEHVLKGLERAKKEGLFDQYEIAHIDWIVEVKDPILFGVIVGCSDRFYIEQWDDDVKIEDLLKLK